MHLAPVPFESALGFCSRLSTFCWSLTVKMEPNFVAASESDHQAMATLALHVLLSPEREVLKHPLFDGPDRLTTFAERLNQGLPGEMARTQQSVYEKEFKPSAGLSEGYQASQYFRLLAAQMVEGLQHCSPKGWASVVDALPFDYQLHLSNALEMFGDYKIGGQVRERCLSQAAQSFWRMVLG